MHYGQLENSESKKRYDNDTLRHLSNRIAMTLERSSKKTPPGGRLTQGVDGGKGS